MEIFKISHSLLLYLWFSLRFLIPLVKGRTNS